MTGVSAYLGYQGSFGLKIVDSQFKFPSFEKYQSMIDLDSYALNNF